MNALHKGVAIVLLVHVGFEPARDVVRMIVSSEFARLIFLFGVAVGVLVPVVVPKLINVVTLVRLYVASIPMPGLERIMGKQPKPAASAEAPKKKAA